MTKYRILIRENSSNDLSIYNKGFFKDNVLKYWSKLQIFDQPKGLLNVPQLTQHKIVKFIGEGAFGQVFKLDNGNILKFNKTRNSSSSPDVYQSIQDRQFSGKSNRNEIPIYDYKMYKSEIQNEEYEVIEMAEVIPLMNYFLSLTQDMKSKNFGSQSEAMSFRMDLLMLENLMERMITFETMRYNTPVIVKRIYEKFLKNKTVNILNKPEFKKLVSGYIAYFVRFNRTTGEWPTDTHSGNLGVLKNNPNVVVQFDY